MKPHERKRPWSVIVITVAACLSCHTVAGNDSPDDPETAWLEAHAVPITDADPDVSEPNLSVLQATIGDARIVGMGEATHGTTEFWGIRQKLSRYLVEEMGFTAILHEAPFPNSIYLHDYVTEGEGTALGAHEKLGYWRYQEMQELIAWMREHNVQRQAGDPLLHYFGYDCAFRDWSEAGNFITGYLQTVDPDAVAEVTTRLDNYTLDDARYIYDFLAANADEYITASSVEQYELILQIAENLEPSWQIWYNLTHGLPELDIREECNIGNVNWIIEHLLDGGKAIIWAHDAHVGNVYLDNVGTQAQMLGSRLKVQYGAAYYIIGTEFYGGSFVAWDGCGGDDPQFIVHQAVPAGEGTYAYGLHQAGIPLFYLDLSQADYSGEGAGWLAGPLKMRFIGASYCADHDSQYYMSRRWPLTYDGIVYFEDTHPTTSISF